MGYGIVFDMDGVIVDNGEFHRMAWERFSRKYGVEDRLDHAALFGRSNDAYLAALFGEGLSLETLASYAEEKEQIYRHLYRGNVKPMPGLLAFLDQAMASGAIFALATSAPRLNADFVLGELGIKDLFRVIVDAGMITHGKPEPEIFLKAAALLETKTARCVVIEDSVHGLEAARRAGMAAICLNHPDPAAVRHLAGICVKDFTELYPHEILKLINKQPS